MEPIWQTKTLLFSWCNIGFARTFCYTKLTYSLGCRWNALDYGLLVFFFGIATFGVIQIITSVLSRRVNSNYGLVSVITDLYKMPKTMIQLSYVQFFSWFALFAMWIYTTPAVTNHIYGTSDTTSIEYNIGADWVGILMSAYNGIAAISAFLLVWMANRMERKKVHSISLIMGGLGLASFYIIKTPELLLVSEIGIGIAWASILSIPYAILTGSLPQKNLEFIWEFLISSL